MNTPETTPTSIPTTPATAPPSYGDESDDGTRAGFDNDFTQRNTTIMTWNLMHLARMLKALGGYDNHGNDRNAWKAGCHFGFENPDHRS